MSVKYRQNWPKYAFKRKCGNNNNFHKNKNEIKYKTKIEVFSIKIKNKITYFFETKEIQTLTKFVRIHTYMYIHSYLEM